LELLFVLGDGFLDAGEFLFQLGLVSLEHVQFLGLGAEAAGNAEVAVPVSVVMAARVTVVWMGVVWMVLKHRLSLRVCSLGRCCVLGLRD
jgi:hypothetical protein